MEKKLKIIIGLVAVLLFISILTFVTVRGEQQSRTKKQVELGNKYLSEGKYKEAILAFEKAISIDKRNVDARVGAARAYVAVNELKKAEKILEEGIEYTDKEKILYLELSSVYIKDNRIEDAINILDSGYEKTKNEDLKKKLKEIEQKLSIVIKYNPLQVKNSTEVKLAMGEINLSAKWELKGKKVGKITKGDNKKAIFTALELGTETIIAKVGSIEKTANIEVKGQVAATIDIVSLAPTATKGDSVEIKAIVKDQLGNELDVEPTWQLSGDIAKLISSKGKTNKIEYVKDGKVQLIVAFENINATAEITVSKRTFTIKTTTVGEGRVVMKEQKDLYYEDDVVELTAIAGEKYKFMKWAGGIEGTQNPITIKVQQNLNIQCIFGYKSLEGIVKSGSTGGALSQAMLKLRKGSNNKTGAVIYTTMAKADGSYELYSYEPGQYTLEIIKSGYITSYELIEIKNTLAAKNLAIMPVVTDTNYRFKLTWGAQPNDLDLHVVKPGGEEIYYGYKKSSDNNVVLDVDMRNSFGPETISINKQENGVYKVFVYNYSGAPSITVSSAKLEVYKGNELIKTFVVPASGSGVIWNVFELEGGNIRELNRIQ